MGEMDIITKGMLRDRPLAFHPVLARVGGGVKAGVLLGQLLYWEGKQADPEGWIYKSIGEFQEETTLTRREQDGAIQSLATLGLIEVELRGLPRVRYFRVLHDHLADVIQAWYEEHPVQAWSTKPPNKHGGNRQTVLAESAKLKTETTSETTAERPSPTDFVLTDEGGDALGSAARPDNEKPAAVNGDGAGRLTVEELVAGWNEVVAPDGPPRVSVMPNSRLRKAKLRIKEHSDHDFWQTVFNEIGRSRFLLGLSPPRNGSEKPFRVTFDWLVANDVNPVRIYEGLYRGDKR